VIIVFWSQVSVVLHTDCCTRQSIEWLQGLIEANETYYKVWLFNNILHWWFQVTNKPLFSSHALDLSKVSDFNFVSSCCVNYFRRLAPMKIWLEIKIGISVGDVNPNRNSRPKHEEVKYLKFRWNNVCIFTVNLKVVRISNITLSKRDNF